MYAMLTRNANEAAMGLAYALSGGDLAGWVSQMNTLSQRIGTTGSTWTDACGIDSGNVTCAVDMYLILRYLMSFDAFVEVSGAPSFTMPAKEKHRSSSVLVSQNAALSKSSGGKYYRSAMPVSYTHLELADGGEVMLAADGADDVLMLCDEGIHLVKAHGIHIHLGVLLTDQLVGAVACLAGAAVQRGVREAGHMAGGHPGLGVHNDGGIQALSLIHISLGKEDVPRTGHGCRHREAVAAHL